jgi:hypothetical protein
VVCTPTTSSIGKTADPTELSNLVLGQVELYHHLLDQLVADEARIIGAPSEESARIEGEVHPRYLMAGSARTRGFRAISPAIRRVRRKLAPLTPNLLIRGRARS